MTKPITPDLSGTGIMKTQLPDKWLPAFTYLTMASVNHPETAAFPSVFLAAFNGNEDALKKVLETVFVAHYAGSKYANTKDQVAISNAIIYLGNQLAAMVERGNLPEYDEAHSKASAVSPKSAKTEIQSPVKNDKAERKPKPAIDPKSNFKKPGAMKHHAR